MPFIPYAIVDEAGIEPITPDSVTGMVQWYDAATVIGVSDNTNVVTISDVSGNGYDLSASGVGPVWRNAANGISGYAAWEWAGVAGGDMTATSRVLPLTDLTIYWVMLYTSNRPWGNENSGSGTNGLGFYASGLIQRNAGVSYDLGATILGTAQVWGLRIGSTHGNELYGSGWGIRNPAGTQYTDAGENFHLGSAGTGDFDFTGKIPEWMSFDRELPETEWFGLLAWLRDKYLV